MRDPSEQHRLDHCINHDFFMFEPLTPVGQTTWPDNPDFVFPLSLTEPPQQAKPSTKFVEPSANELMRHFADIPLLEGYKLLLYAPIVLPISLSEFKAQFVGNHAPHFLCHIV